jgi:hypothetical protein
MVGASSYKGKKEEEKKERIRQRIWEMKCCFLLLLSLAKGVVCVPFGMLLKDRFTIRKKKKKKKKKTGRGKNERERKSQTKQTQTNKKINGWQRVGVWSLTCCV